MKDFKPFHLVLLQTSVKDIFVIFWLRASADIPAVRPNMFPCLFLEGMGGQNMLESDETVFKEIRPGLSNNWPAPIIALFWGLLAVLEVHALNLGKQLPE